MHPYHTLLDTITEALAADDETAYEAALDALAAQLGIDLAAALAEAIALARWGHSPTAPVSPTRSAS
jgi:hypothetical protein